jgi:hypothetical protein
MGAVVTLHDVPNLHGNAISCWHYNRNQIYNLSNLSVFDEARRLFQKRVVRSKFDIYSQIYRNPLGWRLIFCTPTVFVRKVNTGILFTAFLIPLFGIRGRRCNLPVLDCARYHAQRAIRHTNWNIKIDFWEGSKYSPFSKTVQAFANSAWFKYWNVTKKCLVFNIYTIYTKKSVIWCNLWRIPIILWGCLWSEKVWYIIMTFGTSSFRFVKYLAVLLVNFRHCNTSLISCEIKTK